MLEKRDEANLYITPSDFEWIIYGLLEYNTTSSLSRYRRNEP